MDVVCWKRLPAILVLVAACGGDDGGSPAGPPTQLVANGGTNQNWFFSNPLPTPYSVRTLDDDDNGVPGVVVHWAITSGNGIVAPLEDTTDASGVATALHTLGSTGATQSVTASVAIAAIPPVIFTTTVTAASSTAGVTLKNLQFNPDSVVVQVNGSVTWTWNDGVEVHNVTFLTGPGTLPLDGGDQSVGTHTVSFGTTGTYTYTCTNHLGMDGKVIVVN